MRKIKVVKWKEDVVQRDFTGKPILDKNNKPIKEAAETNTISLLEMMVQMKKPEDMPRGLDNFRTMNRLVKAFDKARKTDILELEEADYKFLKDTITSDIPAMWGQIPKAVEAIELFVEAKSDLSKEEESK